MKYAVGDSHIGCLKDSEIKIIWLGPVTMASVGRERIGTTSASILDGILTRYNLWDAEAIILSFGEIDMRCKVHPIVQSGESEDSVINSLVDNFITTVTESTFKRYWIFSIVPPVAVTDRIFNNAEYPFLGSDADRSRYTEKANDRLRQKCAEFNIPFLDVYAKYTDSNGMLLTELSDGEIHIKDNKFVIDAIRHLEE